MKKLTISILIILVSILTACGGTSNISQADSGRTSDTSDENVLPVSTQLLIGTFNLEGTALAVTPEQASELIPLWQVLQSLSSSDSAAQAEMDALVEQIEETMTTKQIQAIKDMNLTPQDISTTMQEQGIQFGGPGQQGQNGTQQNGDFGPPGGGDFTAPDGAVPGGGFGGGGGPGGGFGGGQNLSPDQIATAQALREANGGGGNFRFNITPAPLIEALLIFLQDKAGS